MDYLERVGKLHLLRLNHKGIMGIEKCRSKSLKIVGELYGNVTYHVGIFSK